MPPGLAEMARRRAGIVARGLPSLVAEADARVLGFAYAGPYRAGPLPLHPEDSVYVAADADRPGRRALLLAALIDRATRSATARWWR